MKKTKTEKGITLIALIITIVVLLILAVVTIGAIRNSKIIEHTETAKDTYKEEQIKEEVELFNAEYLLTTKRNMQNTTKEIMIGICKDTGVKPEQLAVVYDLYNVNQNKENENTEGYEKLTEEHVVYRLDKTTEEEQVILEERDVKGLYGDVDLDGYLTENDMEFISLYARYRMEFTELQLKIGDLDGDEYGVIDMDDKGTLELILLGRMSYEKMYEYKFDL